ncbi:MAG: flavin reductase family protein, partial [Solobacterium sp.]|nr:flavin reductase family protein [Solobacterium sp.]
PNRHTYGFMEDGAYFTVGFLKEEYRGAHGIMGSKSGRDMDKDKVTGPTPCPAGETVMYAEAEATLLCRKIYCQDLDVSAFPEAVREKYYGSEPAHRMYIGEVVDIIRK